jgi:hypothetical protein
MLAQPGKAKKSADRQAIKLEETLTLEGAICRTPDLISLRRCLRSRSTSRINLPHLLTTRNPHFPKTQSFSLHQFSVVALTRFHFAIGDQIAIELFHVEERRSAGGGFAGKDGGRG